MIEKTGDMFENPDIGWLIATGNACVKSNMDLVMGAGAAKQLQLLYREAPKVFGDMIANACTPFDSDDNIYLGRRYRRYGMMWYEEKQCGLFQTKYHWRMPSPISLVEYSTECLREVAEDNPDIIFNLNYPAIGHGGLGIKEVTPIIAALPDNVHVWRFK